MIRITVCHVGAKSVETAQLCWMSIPLERRDLKGLIVSIKTSLWGTVLVSSVGEHQI